MAAVAKIVYGAAVAILSRDSIVLRFSVYYSLTLGDAFFFVSERALNGVANCDSSMYRF